MPLYEYRCRSCGHEFVELIKIGTPDSEVECPECGAKESIRQVSAPAAYAIGEGFSCTGGSSGFR